MNINTVENYGAGLANMPTMRERVESLQVEMLKFPQYEPKTTHTFHAGMYCRQVTQAADALIVGKVHKKEHFFILVSGDMVITEGGETKRISGPCLLSSIPGSKRAIYSETEALYMTIHCTDADTVESAENELVEDDPTSMFGVGNILKTPQIEVK
jgi:hypothetical protein